MSWISHLAAPLAPLPPPALDWRLNEGAGTAVSDASGNGLTGTLAGAYAWQTGGVRITGPAAGDGRITRALTGLPTGTAARTLAVWASAWSNTGNGELCGIGSNADPGRRMGIYLVDAVNVVLEVRGAGLGGPVVDRSGLHLYTVTSTTGGRLGDMCVYQDVTMLVGYLSNPNAVCNIQDGEFAVGRIPMVDFVEGATATIHEVMVFAETLTAEQVRSLYLRGPQ